MYALLLALLATVPIALVRRHRMPMAAPVTAANAVALVWGYVPTTRRSSRAWW